MDQRIAQGDPSAPDKEHDSKNRSLSTTLMSEPTTRVVAGPPGLTLDASLPRGNDSPTTGPRCTRGSGGASPRARSGRVPWPPSPATGSPFPQLARPAPDGNGVIAGSPTADRMSPTAAPWAAVAAPTSVPAVPVLSAARGAAAGRPVQVIVQAKPALPQQCQLPHVFQPAVKQIQDNESLHRFLSSKGARDFVGFVLSLNEAVTGTKLVQRPKQQALPVATGNQQQQQACVGDMPPPQPQPQPGAKQPAGSAPAGLLQLSPPLAALVQMLDDLWQLVDETPPVSQSLRYGNPAYRTWSAAMCERAPGWLAQVLPPELSSASVELLPYLLDSFGNATRIDYGTGHETTFVAFLFCLAALGLVRQEDREPLVCVVFHRYLCLMRHVQTTYWLEPAGSHGVWGLDDYQFLPFVWGSAQLIGHPLIRPKSIHNPDILEAYAADYMYLGCVNFVKQVKKGPLAETSPMLDDVSAVISWQKVNGGMIKMYQAEVLSKLPIMQHFLTGSLLVFEG